MNKKQDKFEKALADWKLAKTREEESKCFDLVVDFISDDDGLSLEQWDKVFRASYKIGLRFPDTKEDKKEMEDRFNSLPEYIPMPTGDGVMATFMGKTDNVQKEELSNIHEQREKPNKKLIFQILGKDQKLMDIWMKIYDQVVKDNSIIPVHKTWILFKELYSENPATGLWFELPIRKGE